MPTVASDRSAAPAETAAWRWVRRKLGQVAHERRVLATADKLFDLTQSILRLSKQDRSLLRLAAITHDVGRHVSDKDHPEIGAAMVERTTALDLTAAVRRRLAFLVRHHRGPGGRSDARDRSLRVVLALLRTADALDHRRQPAEHLTLALSARRLSVHVVVAGDVDHARRVYTRPKKYRLLESFLGHAVRVRVDADE